MAPLNYFLLQEVSKRIGLFVCAADIGIDWVKKLIAFNQPQALGVDINIPQ